MPQLTCRDLTLGYDGKIVLSDLSFEVNSGDYLCILGDNGSGKTTLMKTLLRLKSPISGSIVLDGIKPYNLYIMDATGCCPLYLEFIWNGSHSFPDDYPDDNAPIEIFGVFGKYDELGETYYYLAVDELNA